MDASVARDSVLANCLVAHNPCAVPALRDVTLVNCSICANGTPADKSTSECVLDGTVQVYNSVMVANTSAPLGSSGSSVLYGSCFSHGTGSGGAAFFASVDENSVTGANQYQFFAPLLGDFRLVAGAQSVGIANSANLAAHVSTAGAVAQIDIYKDISGAAIPSSGAINAGCIQETAVPAGGVIQFNRAVYAKGYRPSTVDRHLWMFSETPLEVFNVRARSQPLNWFCISESSRAIWPEMDGSLWCVMPPAGVVVTNSVEYPATSYYVSTTGDDANAGTKAAPFHTIQRAIDALSGLKTSALIYVAAGDYDYGAQTNASYGISRVQFGSYKARVLGEGADVTTIWGELDTTEEGLANEGRGTNGMRCVCFSTASCCVQGFTLRRGRAQAGTADDHRNKGGLAIGFSTDHSRAVVSDCVLEDGAAFRGSAAVLCKLVRCKIVNCPAYGGAVVRPGTLDTCAVWSCNLKGGYMFEANMYGCTVVSTNSQLTADNNNLPPMVNSIFMGRGASVDYLSANSAFNGNVCWNTRVKDVQGDVASRNVRADPLFRDAAHDDYRVLAASPALTCSVMPSNYWQYSQTGIDGKPRVYVDGKPLAGAYQGAVACLAVDASGLEADCTVSTTGYVPLEPGETVTVTATPVAGSLRQMRGFIVNGEEILSDPPSFSYTAPADGSYDVGGTRVRPSVTADWFVKPDGDDSANGWGTNSAKRTLAHVMTLTRSGDTVHALPGTYAEGSTNKHSTAFVEGYGSATSSRVVVPAGVTLVADAGPEHTVIKGQGASSGGDAYDCGTDGVRCATVLAGGILKDFTLTGGRTGVASSYGNSNDDRNGAAVLAPGQNDTAIISGCVISNNVCARGPCSGGHYENCRIVENKSMQTSGGLWHGSASGCLFDRNWCGSAQLMRFYGRLENCTIGSGNKHSDGVVVPSAILVDPRGPLVNCVVLGRFSTACTASNCVFVAGQFKTNESSVANMELSSAEAALLDANGVPLSGSPLIDAGDASLSSLSFAGTDFFGVRRFYNGALDVGAYEHDWRPDYRAVLGNPSHLALLEASPYVVRGTGGTSVDIPDEAVLQCVIAPSLDTVPFMCIVEAETTGAGELTVSVNGEDALVIPGGTAKAPYRIKCADPVADIRFSYAGTGNASIYKLSAEFPGMAIILR